ncbi:MAG TPA: PAS domain S-box protein, partial [Candidatus Limnocylindrales bacterium]|nr:PAS domain S-box protein [Candidatus Limnocylindrales bacterium]
MSTDPLRHLNPGAIPVHAVLAVASLAIGLAEVVAAGSGSPTAPPTAVILLALAATFGVAARARHEGRSAAAARLTAGAILVATPLLAVIYPAEAGVELGAPIMFLVLLPHLEGIATVAFAAATVAVTASLPILGALDNGGRPIAEAVGSATGLLTASSLLVALTWASQRATRAASRRYEDLVADVPVGIARVSVDGRFLEVNDAYAKMLGYPSREALLATPVLAVYADPADRLRLVEAANARGQLRVELPLRRLDGSTVWARIGTRVSRDTAGNPRWYDGAIEDITAEREAASARERLAAIVETAGDAIYATSLDGTVLSWNAAAERIYGWTTGEVLGRPVFSFTARSEHGLIRQRLGRIARGERVGPLDASRVRRNGSPLTLSVVISPLRDGAGSVVGASVVERDVTKQRATEGRLERLRHERALVVDALRSLRPGATVEETADAICTEISRTGFGHAVVLGWESADRLAFLASRIDGRPAPTMRGLIEPDRARLLDERTAAGPWVDAVNPADPNPHRAALAGAGVRALSYSAIVHEGKRVGILVVGAPGVDVNRLSERLTALAEFAAICGQLLGPGLRERRLRSRAREEISAIIASGAFEPVFQPIVALESGATVGFEALTRFTDGRSADEVFAAAVRAEVGLDLELA